MPDYVKLHTDVLDNRKIQTLPDHLVRPWLNFLLLSRRNGGFLPDVSDLAFRLRVDQATAASWITQLLKLKLLDRVGTAGDLQPHDWNDWNPPVMTDKTGASRQAKWRENQKLKSSSPTPLTPEEESNTSEDKISVTPLRNETVTPLRNAVTEWPLTSIAIREDFPSTEDTLIIEVISGAQRAYIAKTDQNAKPLTDKQIAGAVKAAREGFPKQYNAAPYRKNVAQVISSWVEAKNHASKRA